MSVEGPIVVMTGDKPVPVAGGASNSALIQFPRLITFGLVILTFIGFAGRMFWWADLMAHMRFHYAAGLLCLSVFFFLFRELTLALIAIAGVFLNVSAIALASSANAYFSDTALDTLPGEQIRIVSYNANAGNVSPQHLVQWLTDTKPDIAVLIEVNHAWLPILDKLIPVFPYQNVTHSSTIFGMAILSRFPLISPTMDVAGPLHLPVLSADVETPVGKLCVIGVHPNLPFGAFDALARNLYIDQVGAMARTRGVACILAGDFNATPWSSGFESLRTLPNLQPEAWRVPATWPAIFGDFGIPLDHILLTMPIDRAAPLVFSRIWAGPDLPGSDHRPLVAEIKTQE